MQSSFYTIVTNGEHRWIVGYTAGSSLCSVHTFVFASICQFLSVAPKIFSVKSVPPLKPNSGDDTAYNGGEIWGVA